MLEQNLVGDHRMLKNRQNKNLELSPKNRFCDNFKLKQTELSGTHAIQSKIKEPMILMKHYYYNYSIYLFSFFPLKI
jgi:hypothetical protein